MLSVPHPIDAHKRWANLGIWCVSWGRDGARIIKEGTDRRDQCSWMDVRLCGAWSVFIFSLWSYFCISSSPEEGPGEPDGNHGIRVSHVTSPRWIHTTESPEGPGSWGLLTFCGIHHRHPLLLCCSDAGYELWEKNPGSANGHFKKLKQEQLFRSTLALMAHNGIAL